MTAVFRSKVDGKVKAVALAMPCAAVIAIATSPQFAAGILWLPAIATILVTTMIVWVFLSTYYEFKSDVLLARSGPFSWRIRLDEISAVRESRSVRSGPALSMDRLEITYGMGV